MVLCYEKVVHSVWCTGALKRYAGAVSLVQWCRLPSAPTTYDSTYDS